MQGIANREASAESAKYPMQKMTRSVTTLALLWFYTEDDKYAKTAGDLLRYFFLDPATTMNPNLQWAQYRPGYDFVGFVNARLPPLSN
ncbi:hypothetical protein, variant [Sphaeroforma arctica JP610]|uniref:Alginate lyase domain-containing protein n=1 Tax=Sphaeroforma arctica JP610 TaxID=667725 RepID=A0A0L0G3K6_9EUKA|nr:hypothetical protein, variant [Sphaeroforma arctica JP610]KNC83449.1 hypothetical protein, variant [Sphaeroforma arctica JP610]|eukprot:XP_014157351.1 hypothetical protein, variant [Sphaeroforma arctica JP610]